MSASSAYTHTQRRQVASAGAIREPTSFASVVGADTVRPIFRHDNLGQNLSLLKWATKSTNAALTLLLEGRRDK